MNEDFLHYIWQQRLFLSDGLSTVEGEPVEIVSEGTRNTDSGPDFIDVRARIGGTLWAGCVEIHVRASDWERHGHHIDPAYNNVVLHVVYQHDTDVFNARKSKVPTIELHFDQRYFDTFIELTDTREVISCKRKLADIDEFSRLHWMERLAVERVEYKANAILQTYEATGHDWEETLYRRLARNFGFSLNALPFEAVAKSLPLNILLKHRDNLLQLEALLFGQAGMLADTLPADEYYTSLQREYAFLKEKYELSPIEKYLWKFLRLRPINFPTLRIAQFAKLIHTTGSLFSQVLEVRTPTDLEPAFTLLASDYWNTHYVFRFVSPQDKFKAFGRMSYSEVLINTIIPFLFVYGKVRDLPDFRSRAVELLEQCPPEKNFVLTNWKELGLNNDNAFHSQALLHLRNEYCVPKRCLHCAFGNAFISKGTNDVNKTV